MEAVDVLVRIDRRDDLLRIDLIRQRQLDQDAVDGGISVEARDQREQIGFARHLRQAVIETSHTGAGGHLHLAADVAFARRIVADEHDREARHDPAVPRKTMHRVGDLAAQVRRDRLAVYDLRGHGPPRFLLACRTPAMRGWIAPAQLLLRHRADLLQRCREGDARAVDLDALDPCRGARNHAHVACRNTKRPGEQADERRVRLAGACRRTHAHPQDAASIREPLNAFDRIATASRREPQSNDDAVLHHPPRPRRDQVQNTFGRTYNSIQ